MKRYQLAMAVSLAIFSITTVFADGHGNKVYADFPVTVKDYSGDKKSSVSYGGQVARHVLHNSVKKLAGQGTGKPDAELKAKLMSYLNATDYFPFTSRRRYFV